MKIQLIAIITASLCFGVVGACAQTREVARSLTLEQLVEDALRENPQLKAMRAKWEAMLERPAQERSLPNPMLMYRGMDARDKGNFPITNEKRFEIEQQFPWFGKRALRGSIAANDAEMMKHEFQIMSRDVVLMAKEGYFDLYGVQRAMHFTRADREVLKRLEKIAETKYATGEVSQQDVLKAQAETSMVEARLLELEQQEITINARLNTLLNRRADEALGLAVTAPDDKLNMGLEELFRLAEATRQETVHAQTQRQRHVLERELMRKEYLPDYKLGLEYRSFRDSDDMVMFTVGVELPIWRSKYKAGVREAEKMIESSEASIEATLRQIALEVRDAHFKLQTARRTVELYRTALVPQAESRFAASEAGYRAGKVDFLDLLESQRFLLNARVMFAMAEANLGMQLARIERAVGTNLKNVKPQKEEKK